MCCNLSCHKGFSPGSPVFLPHQKLTQWVTSVKWVWKKRVLTSVLTSSILLLSPWVLSKNSKCYGLFWTPNNVKQIIFHRPMQNLESHRSNLSYDLRNNVNQMFCNHKKAISYFLKYSFSFLKITLYHPVKMCFNFLMILTKEIMHTCEHEFFFNNFHFEMFEIVLQVYR